jgi:hypothetical protein
MALGKIKLKKSEVALLSLFAFASVYLFETYYLKPRKVALEALKVEESNLQMKIDQNQILLTTLKNKVPASIELKTSNELLDKYMKSNDRFSNVLTSIISNSNQIAFTVNRIATESQAQLMGYAQTLYSIQASASFIAIGKFLESLEDSPLLTEVQSIDIERTGNELRMCKANIKLFNYVSGTIDPGLQPANDGAIRAPAGDVSNAKAAVEQATVAGSAVQAVDTIVNAQANAAARGALPPAVPAASPGSEKK